MKQLLRIRINHQGRTALGPGKIELLNAIAKYGSISAAAKSMQMSYKRAWELVDEMNQCFDELVVLSSAGGQHGGGAQVTPFGEMLIENYQRMIEKATKSNEEELLFISKHLKD